MDSPHLPKLRKEQQYSGSLGVAGVCSIVRLSKLHLHVHSKRRGKERTELWEVRNGHAKVL